MKPAFFPSAVDFRAWLAAHHATTPVLLVGFYKKDSGRPSITYPEALDEALAYGWIDGVRRRLDAEAYTVRFTPRRPGSIWSAINTRRAEELISQGRMAPPGLRVFRERDGKKHYAPPPQFRQLDPALEAALRANRKAAAFFDAQPPGYRNSVIVWVMSAKKEDTRARRFATLIEHSTHGTRIDPMNPYR